MKQTYPFPTVSVFEIPFSKLSMKDTVKYLTEAVQSGQPHHVITANPIMVMTAVNNPEYKEMMQRAEIIVPDGTGIVWAAGVGGDPLEGRVTGFELLHELLKVGETYRWKFFLLGTTAEVIQEAAERLQMQYPAAIICGYRDGFLGLMKMLPSSNRYGRLHRIFCLWRAVRITRSLGLPSINRRSRFRS